MHRRSCLLFVVAALAGCATLGPNIEGVERTVQNEEEVVDTSLGEIRPVKASWSDGALVASVERTKICTRYREYEVATQKTTRRPAENLVASSLLSTGLLAGGIASGIAYASASQTPEYRATPEDEMHPADWLAIGSLVGVLGGAYGVYNAVHVIRGTRPKQWSGDPIVEERRDAVGEPEPCGAAGVPTVVTLGTEDDEIERKFMGGEVQLDFPSDASLCPESMIETPVRIDWRAGGDAGTLWTGSLEDCARAHAARRHLDRAKALASKTGDDRSVAVASSELAEARRMLDGLPDPHADKADLVARADQVEATVKAAAAAGLEKMLRSLEMAAEATAFDVLYDSGRLAVDTSRLVPGSQASAVMRVHRVLGRAASTADHARAISTGSPTLTRCLVDKICAEGLDRDELLALYQPLVQTAQTAVEESAKRVREIAREDSISSVPSRLREEESVARWCTDVTWTTALDAPCSNLIRIRKQAWATLAKREQERVEQSLRRTEKAWKSIFTKCRKVSRGFAAFQDISPSQCGADCRRAYAELQADAVELKTFSVEDPTWNSWSLKSVREGCEQAGCPKCP